MKITITTPSDQLTTTLFTLTQLLHRAVCGFLRRGEVHEVYAENREKSVEIKVEATDAQCREKH